MVCMHVLQMISSKTKQNMKRNIHTTLLNALHGRPGNLLINRLRRILDRLHGRLASNGRGAEQAGLAGDLSAEHGYGSCGDGGGGNWCVIEEVGWNFEESGVCDYE